ncbi:MAG: hypothetical protein QM674_01525 [Burkholderiaceae bacterium]
MTESPTKRSCFGRRACRHAGQQGLHGHAFQHYQLHQPDGGLINIETKRAAVEPLTRAGVGDTSDSIFGTHVGLGRRFGQGHYFT